MSAISQQPIGRSAIFYALLDKVSNAAALERPVLIMGERGTGKELIASRLHFLSPRWEQSYIRVNCAAFTDEMLDKELFGQSFLDGREDTNGRFYLADEGTLFLDNIEQTTLRLQEKLMRAIEYGHFEAGLETEVQEVDVRIIAASGTDLRECVAKGTFREDLLDRLAFDVVHLPPLRIRPDDIAPLAEHFGRKASGGLNAESFPGFTPEVLAQLESLSWPGNVRELKNVIERSVANSFLQDESLSHPIERLYLDPFEGPEWVKALTPTSSHKVEDKSVSGNTGPANTDATFNDRVMTFERRLIDEALSSQDHHQGKAANYLGLSYHQFRGLLRKHGLKK
ncbi:psp operon transcriptional activator [Litorimonas taeanensis]|uniref:Psp operon transcriptional activator n=1 Tax=Litorimonas taeanensis TaxID=568099 RepID=A0A420WE45_9PROT|nr:sigma 54-interacting transcriptional regulator [Litorimonas taeanensis]RKQ69172.1 psp operon transcriptional activator [Litorimonas taeanensis]